MLHLIWAEDENGAIGNEGGMPWRLPNDLKYFKQQTLHHPVVMGRKTFESLGNRPLPNRTNIILTKNPAFHPENVLVMKSVAEVLAFALDKEVYIIGGRTIYQQFLPIADVLHRTRIFAAFSADTAFPTVDWAEWGLVERKAGIMDEKNQHPHEFQEYRRNGKKRVNEKDEVKG